MILKKEEGVMSNNIRIYPDKGFLDDYKEVDFGSLISTLSIDCMLCNGTIVRLGDSQTYVYCDGKIEKGKEGIGNYASCCRDFYNIIKEAVSGMSGKYKSFYKFFLEDFRKNGVKMPFYGQIIEPEK